MPFRLIGALLALSSLACASVDPDRVGATLRLPSAPDCRPPMLSTLSVTALGDFPTTDATVENLVVGGTTRELSRFPTSTLALSARASTATWDGFGVASVSELRVLPELLVLPLGRSCAIADPEARLPRGGAIMVLSESSVFVAGGLDERGLATRRLAILEVRSERVELPAPTLLNPTAFASASFVPGGESLLVAGGASGETGEVRDTWERVSLLGEPRSFGALRSPRRDHAAIAVSAGALRGVLLVGGSDGARVLDTLELVDVDGGTSRSLSARLTIPRRAPSVVALSALAIAVFGGETEGGVLAPGIDVLDLEAESIAAVAGSLGGAEWAVALPDGRIAASVAGRVQIALHGALGVADAGDAPAISSPVAVALATGRVLVAGRGAHGERLAMLFDPSTGVSGTASVSPVPTRMIAMPDGTTLALDERGASIRRDDRVTAFDSPRPMFLFADDRGELSLDASSRWSVDGDALVALAEGARIDVPVLRFRALAVEVDASGSVSLALVDDLGGLAALVAIDEVSASIGECLVVRTSGDPVRVTRRDAGVDLEADGALASCAVPDLPHRVGIAVVASMGARLRSLSLSRL